MLSKLIAGLIAPLGTALLLASLGLLAIFVSAAHVRLRRIGLLLMVFAVGWLWLWSVPLVGDRLRGWIEDQAGARRIADLPKAQAIVVLGGGVRGARPPQRPDPDLGAAGDRVWHAARLYRAGKAERIILSGGITRTGDGSEADAMHVLLRDLGVPDAAIVIEGRSETTETNAQRVAELLARERVDGVLLVTSALHMPRARCLFERAGVRLVPAPTDFEIVGEPFDLLRLVPDADTLNGSGRAMKELLGWGLCKAG